MALISFSRRLHDLAEAQPDRPAVTCGADTITRAALVQAGDDLAVYLRERGVGEGDMVTIAVPNSIDWFIAYLAAWRLGAVPQPISARLPQREVDSIMELADPSAVVGVEVAGRLCIPYGFRAPHADASHLPDLVSRAWKAPTSGGSTGRPKLIVSGDPALFDTDAPPALLLGTDGCLVMPGPLYHNGPGVWSCQALLNGNHVVVLPRFDAEATLSAIQQYRGTVLYVVPTMMKRIWRLHDDIRHAHDLSSLRVVWHLAEPCPEWLKQCWIDWLGAERIYELYAGTEAQTATIITGSEWLAHRGSVGRAQPGTVMITDADGNEVPVGEKGEVWLRSTRDTPTYHYLGAAARTREGGWESLGDMGHLDEQGYLYLGDRAADMILSGGANIYPAEVEAALQEHAGVHSCAVIGLPDDDRGNTVHAIIEADPGTFDLEELKQFLAERLVVYKLPRTFEFVETPLRDDAGKVRRSALRQERLDAITARAAEQGAQQ
jgi:bile acid-coenzyme A ligase